MSRGQPTAIKTRRYLFLPLLLTIAVLLLIVVSRFTLEPTYYYVSSDERFVDVEIPLKGRDIGAVRQNFDRYVKNGNRDVVLIRVTPWRWYIPHLWVSYCVNDRWKVPCRPDLMRVVEQRHHQYFGDQLPDP